MVFSLSELSSKINVQEFNDLHGEMSFDEYFALVQTNPKLVRTSYQYLYDMISAAGSSPLKMHRKTVMRYHFFDDPQLPIFDLNETLEQLVKTIKGAACGYGPEHRVILLTGPVGSSKSTICRRIKRGLESYSRKPEGAWYSFKWVNLPTGKDGLYISNTVDDPMNENPIKLIPPNIREQFLDALNKKYFDSLSESEKSFSYKLKSDGELNPLSRFLLEQLRLRYDGNWKKVIDEHIRVVRRVHSEADRTGIATFQPKDEKNQDSTELTGDIDFAKIQQFGKDSDPRAFNFDGEFCAANRGVCEFIEVLKLAKEFLYDLLGVSQERQIKPKKFSQISVDEVLIGHTNLPEFDKLKNDHTMEALRDRTIVINVPYLLRHSQEVRILQHDFSNVRQHIAPHTLEIASLWSILTRLQEDKEGKISLVDKAKLYDGKMLPGWTDDSIKEMKDKHPNEGMLGGISVRYVQDKISNCLASHFDYINPFMVLNELEKGLHNSSSITNKDDVARYSLCIDYAKKELDQILKNEVQRALIGDEDAIVRLCTNYIDNVVAYVNNSKVLNSYTNKEELPDERLMRSIEEKIGITEKASNDFRRSITQFIGTFSVKGQQFRWDSNPELKKALELKLFEDTKDHIKLSSLSGSSSVLDKATREKIDAVKTYLIKNCGYNEASATDVLQHVGSVWSRGEIDED